MSQEISVWLHKETGQLWEHFPTILGNAITCVDADIVKFTNWTDWQDRGFWHFNDEAFYNPENFIDLGPL